MQMEKERPDRKEKSRVKRIAVLSGKGGVGKTTVAVNIATMLAKQGQRVGLLDADIDCPNVPEVLGIDEKIQLSEDGLFRPPEKNDVKVSSMALFEQEGPTMWRGPLIHKAIMQLLEKTDWGDLDYLVIDMPPGTSDAALTIMQFVGIDAVVIVTTSQKLAVKDAEKSAKMAMQFHLPTGVVENMAGDVFGQGGGEKIAEQLSIPLLGKVNLDRKVASGEPASEREFEIITMNIERMLV